MPTYEYNCPKCGAFEQFHSINTVLTQCPKCGSKVQRLISQNNNVIFKGSGFHTTDYRSGDYKTKAANESSGSTTNVSPTKTDAKTAETKSANKGSVSAKNESKAS